MLPRSVAAASGTCKKDLPTATYNVRFFDSAPQYVAVKSGSESSINTLIVAIAEQVVYIIQHLLIIDHEGHRSRQESHEYEEKIGPIDRGEEIKYLGIQDEADVASRRKADARAVHDIQTLTISRL